MSPLVRAVRGVLWLVASGFIVTGAMNIGLEFMRHHYKHTEISLLRCALWSLPLVFGLVMALATPSLARQLTGEEEEEE
jgi:TRAP-type C4-dicarboxylate transport system permease small subunit